VTGVEHFLRNSLQLYKNKGNTDKNTFLVNEITDKKQKGEKRHPTLNPGCANDGPQASSAPCRGTG
jgi:hypothetical protein